MRNAGKAMLLVALCTACGACMQMAPPRLPYPGPAPHQPTPAWEKPATVPADFPDPADTKRVCKDVETDHGKQRVCM